LNVWTREPNLQVGDLVYHLLYGREWMAMVMSVDNEQVQNGLDKKVKKTLVRIVPGTEFVDFFDSRPPVSKKDSNCGWISNHWLVKFADFS